MGRTLIELPLQERAVKETGVDLAWGTASSNGRQDGAPMARWYAIKTRFRHEKKVRDQLLDRHIETFLPIFERWSQWKDRRKKLDWPLFPGYCFARFPLTARLRILVVPGVVGLVGPSGHPEPVSDTEVEGIRRLVATRFQYDYHPFLAEGMEVEVIHGPLVGVRGRLLRKDRSTRLVLVVTLIRQSASVEIHPADVEPI